MEEMLRRRYWIRVRVQGQHSAGTCLCSSLWKLWNLRPFRFYGDFRALSMMKYVVGCCWSTQPSAPLSFLHVRAERLKVQLTWFVSLATSPPKTEATHSGTHQESLQDKRFSRHTGNSKDLGTLPETRHKDYRVCMCFMNTLYVWMSNFLHRNKLIFTFYKLFEVLYMYLTEYHIVI